MTGKLIPDFFPKVFGPDGDQPLDANIVRENFEALAGEIGDGAQPEAVADGFLAIAVAKMAEAIKTISVARGYDVTRYALNCFGGAGGQHACDVADALAITTVLIHPLSSLLSAYGMGLADIAAQRAQGVDEPLDAEALARVGLVADALARAAAPGGREPGRRARERQDPSPGAVALCRLRHDDRGRAGVARRRCGARSRRRIERASASSTAPRRSSSRRCRPRRSAARRASPSGREGGAW